MQALLPLMPLSMMAVAALALHAEQLAYLLISFSNGSHGLWLLAGSIFQLQIHQTISGLSLVLLNSNRHKLKTITQQQQQRQEHVRPC